MTIWPPKRQDLHRPAYRTLAEIVLKAIDAGELRAGDRLPTHRDLAFQLSVSVQTVSRAYDELIRRGAICGEVGRGTFVRDDQGESQHPFLPENQRGAIVDCSMLKPVFEPFHLDMMRRAVSRLGEDMPATVMSSFRPSAALTGYARSSLRWIAQCGLDADSQGVLLTNGNTAAMTTALMTAARPGELVVTEELGHHTLMPLARYLGLQLQGLALDGEGIMPDAFAAACERGEVKVLYVMPAGLNPCALTMSGQRRRDLVKLARKYDILIIENDAWGPLQTDRAEPIAALAPERTFYFTSLTKCIMPGLRIGWLVVPEKFESAAANRHLVTSWMATPLLAEIASRWIDDGTMKQLLEWQKKALGERNLLASRTLSGIVFNASENGLHVWLPLPGDWTEDAFVAHARFKGVAVATGSSFQITENAGQAGVRICLGGEAPAALEKGLRVLARLVRSDAEPALLTL